MTISPDSTSRQGSAVFVSYRDRHIRGWPADSIYVRPLRPELDERAPRSLGKPVVHEDLGVRQELQ